MGPVLIHQKHHGNRINHLGKAIEILDAILNQCVKIYLAQVCDMSRSTS